MRTNAIHLKIDAKTKCGIVITPQMENEKKITLNIEEVTCKNCIKAMRKTVKQDNKSPDQIKMVNQDIEKKEEQTETKEEQTKTTENHEVH